MKQIIGFFASYGCVSTSQGVIAVDNILDFLLQYRNSINCFYHLSYNVASILRSLNLGEPALQILYDSGEVEIKPDYTIYYLSNKYFAIKKGNYWDCPYVQFCDISQYIPWKIEPAQDQNYVLSRAKEAQKIGQEVYNTLAGLGLKPENMTSPIRVFEKGYLNRLSLPTVDDLPNQAGEYAYYCCHGGWLEVFRKGHWTETWDYDLSSAYPSYLAQLKDLHYGSWLQSKDFQPDAEYGYLLGKVTINKHFSPIIFSIRGGDESLNYTPVGTWDYNLLYDKPNYIKTPYCITKKQYEIIYQYKLGTFEIYDAWWWFSEGCIATPLKSTVERLYAAKEKNDGLKKDVVKRIMSGLWGKLLEVQGDGFGDHFNPVWGAEVEVNTRMQVFEACAQNNLIPLSIAVDGILSDKPLQFALNNGGMGNWKLSSHCPAIVISSGVVAVRDKEHIQDFSLDYDWLLDAIKQSHNATEYEKSKSSPVSLDKSFNYNNLDKLGTIETITRTIDIQYELKRCYIDRPITGSDLLNNKYKSVAWDISFFGKGK